MGEISDALSRARKDKGTARDESAADAPARPEPRSHSPIYEPPRAREDDTPSDEFRRLREREAEEARDAHESAPEAETRPEPRRAPSPVAAPVDERPFVPIEAKPGRDWIYRLCVVEPDSPGAVRFRHFAVRMRGMLDQRSAPSVVVTSAVAGEGKSTIASNLALALASVAPESRIALVDMDLRRGVVGRIFGCPESGGVEAVLSGRASIDDVVVRTNVGRLNLIPKGATPPDPHSLLGATADAFFGEMHRRYDYLVCDGPPVLPVPDTPLISKHVGGCLAVVASGRTRHSTFRDLPDLIPRTNWFGVFLNESKAVSNKDRYGYYSSTDSGRASEGFEGEEAYRDAAVNELGDATPGTDEEGERS